MTAALEMDTAKKNVTAIRIVKAAVRPVHRDGCGG
jgi:hypothetical protein